MIMLCAVEGIINVLEFMGKLGSMQSHLQRQVTDHTRLEIGWVIVGVFGVEWP